LKWTSPWPSSPRVRKNTTRNHIRRSVREHDTARHHPPDAGRWLKDCTCVTGGLLSLSPSLVRPVMGHRHHWDGANHQLHPPYNSHHYSHPYSNARQDDVATPNLYNLSFGIVVVFVVVLIGGKIIETIQVAEKLTKIEGDFSPHSKLQDRRHKRGGESLRRRGRPEAAQPSMAAFSIEEDPIIDAEEGRIISPQKQQDHTCSRSSNPRNKSDYEWEMSSPSPVSTSGAAFECKRHTLSTSTLICHKELGYERLIGQGGFGTVYAGKWRGTPVAIKVLVCKKMTADLIAEFEKEVAMMSSLRHPNICLFMGAVIDSPHRCIVTELMRRYGSLWDVLRMPDVRLSWHTKMRMALDICCGMNYLHMGTPPVLHRDLKSANLLVTDSLQVKLSDFGMARLKAHCQALTGNCGTLQWAAPEVISGASFQEKSDVYSFGIVCWELLTGKCPFEDEGMNQIQIAMGVVNSGLRPKIPSTTPHAFGQLLQACWLPAVNNRPTFTQILDYLEDEVKGAGVRQQSPGTNLPTSHQ